MNIVPSHQQFTLDNISFISGSPPRGTFTQVRIFFSSLRYVRNEEFNLITFDNVLSQVGGISGIWLGVSMLSTAKAALHVYRAYKKKVVDAKEQFTIVMI